MINDFRLGSDCLIDFGKKMIITEPEYTESSLIYDPKTHKCKGVILYYSDGRKEIICI